ncbi:hypothetical protein CCACVL1_19097 [Corchorus capsularis]|uniref:Uncharacterized protein n=1 Tax=Corchorus capsularis TaxID=210143 RepID=A0A1R3HIF2_COCAP|nr:hypothetical protein CCACVL1_19097 [Corchorus capsularis]
MSAPRLEPEDSPKICSHLKPSSRITAFIFPYNGVYKHCYTTSRCFIETPPQTPLKWPP